MQHRPTADELLDAIGDLLGDEVIEAVPEALRHRARVAESLTRIVAREIRLAPHAARHEVDVLTSLLGVGADDEASGDIRALRTDLGRRLRATDDPELERAAWEALVSITRDDLAIAKPGHDRWEGE